MKVCKGKMKLGKKYKCFFCGQTFSKAGIDAHYSDGRHEFPVCMGAEPKHEGE